MSSYEELVAQREALTRQIEEVQEKEKQQAVKTVQELISRFSLTVSDCFRMGKATSKEKKTVVVKFRGPNGETWAGRGRSPNWISALEASGQSRESYKV